MKFKKNSLLNNFLLNTDTYKASMFAMYPADMDYMSAYLEARGGEFPVSLYFGLQAFIKEYLQHPITAEDVENAKIIYQQLGARFNYEGWMGIVKEHNGYLPIEIEAIEEGTVLPIGNVMLQVVNTDPKYAWLTSFIETALIRAIWYPTTVATVSWMSKQIIKAAFEQTSDTPELVRLYLEDFGCRGVSSLESAALGGMAHLINFDRTNTIVAAIAAHEYYDAPNMPGSASWFQEHSTTTTWGKANELESFRHMLQYTESGSVGLLIDTYDHDNAVINFIGKDLNNDIAKYPGLVCIRCDSGNPTKVPVDTVENLMNAFGFKTNSKGYKILPDNIRVVQGDGLNLDTLKGLYQELQMRGLAADNIICGMGTSLLQKVTRDTMHFGYKVNALNAKGIWEEVAKHPKGDAIKRSKKGRLALIKVEGQYQTVNRDSVLAHENLLQPIFRNGQLLKDTKFTDIIARSEQYEMVDVKGATIAAQQTPMATSLELN